MIVFRHKGEMGKILSPPEPAETEFPGGIMAMATRLVNMELPLHTTWIKADVYSDEESDGMMPRHTQKRLIQSDKQEVNCFTSQHQIKDVNTIKDMASKVDRPCVQSMTLTREPEESPLQSFSEKERSDSCWNNRLYSYDEDDQFYGTESSEDMWLHYEHGADSSDDGKNNDCFNETCFSSSEETERLCKISNDVTIVNPPDLSIAKNKNSNFTKTEEKIRSLKALLAEQEKQLSRLKNENKERIFQSKESLTTLKEECSFPLVTRLFENGREFSVQRQHKLTTKDDNFYSEHKTSIAAGSIRRKRVGSTEHASLSNTKRFRYHLRKDIPHDIKRYLRGITDQKRSFSKDNSTSQYVIPDIKKCPFTQDEFLSFLRLVRTSRLVVKD